MGTEEEEVGMDWAVVRLYLWVNGGEGKDYLRVEGVLGVVEVGMEGVGGRRTDERMMLTISLSIRS